MNSGSEILMEARRTEVADAPVVSEILKDAARWLLSKGIDQWHPHHFREERLSRQMASGEFWVGEVEGAPTGVFRLLWSDPILWRGHRGEAGYIHNVAVAEGWHGKGIGRLLLAEAERLIAERGRGIARLDCILGNERLRRYYLETGYRQVGERIGEKLQAWLFEKHL
ncbi:MAG: GNAT family N-acetyltransferase [Actinobacteria bacterium]|nr:GNAT family N-acetyltransferase [Actinomycetota bacterium]